MHHEIGVKSSGVKIKTERGSNRPETPAPGGFNNHIPAIKLPAGLADRSLVATINHPQLGKLLFFDPTDDLTPFGQIRGELQDNYGLLVTQDGGELIDLPQQLSSTNSIGRVAKLTLDTNGRLQGDVQETRLGDRPAYQRGTLRHVTRDAERIKPIESLLAGSLSNFQITKATVVNLH